MKTKSLILPLLAGITLALGGCARIQLEGGDKPIHIVQDINIRVDRQLDDFFDYQKTAASQPASAPATAI